MKGLVGQGGNLIGSQTRKYACVLGLFASTPPLLSEWDYILKSAHPSPLSAYNGFFGSKIFSKTNEILTELNYQEIKWED